jgi:hypothetical protein
VKRRRCRLDTPVEASSSARPLISGMRAMFVVSCVTVSLAGFQLFVLSEYTDRFFAWTIDVPLTAAFLGASYWGSFALVFVASRQHTWALARVAVPGVWLFTVLTLLATLIHIDLFRMDSVFGWAWLIVYLVVSLGYGVFWVRQLRIAGGDPPRQAPLPTWLRFVLGVQAAIMLIWGTALFLVPQTMAALWPWALTPLTGQAVGAWLIGVGVTAAQMCWENDFGCVYAGMVGYAVLGALHLLALARYVGGTVDWSEAGGWIYLLFVLSVLSVGLYGWLGARRRRGRLST